ncbi:MAG: Transrane secretion effector, partial [Actinomycetota bacterium]
MLDRTGSAAAAGLLGALVSLPGIVVSPFVGALIDRVGRRKV